MEVGVEEDGHVGDVALRDGRPAALPGDVGDDVGQGAGARVLGLAERGHLVRVEEPQSRGGLEGSNVWIRSRDLACALLIDPLRSRIHTSPCDMSGMWGSRCLLR